MLQTTFTSPGHDTYQQVLKATKALLEQGRMHINICWPRPTTALFMRKKMNRELEGSFGVRHTTCQELTSLIEDSKGNQCRYQPPKTLDEFSVLVKIAREVLPDKAPWPSVDLIDETLKVMTQLNGDALEYARSNFPKADQCLNKYFGYTQELSEYKEGVQDQEPTELNHILGTCIVVKNSANEKETDLFIEAAEPNITAIFCPTLSIDEPKVPIYLFEDTFDEIDSVFAELVNSEIEADSTAIIVPDSSFQRLLLARAEKFDIPISGNSNKDIFDHELIVCANILLEASDVRKRQNVEQTIQRFSWFDCNGNNEWIIANKLNCTLDSIASATTTSERFTEITQFFVNNTTLSFFESDEKSSSLAQQAFSILLDLSEFDEICSLEDSIFQLDTLAQEKLRLNRVGEGIYVALPDELIGAHFKKVYVLGLKDKYISKPPFSPSLINRDQYLLLGIDEEATSRERVQSRLSWLKNCADDVVLSSSKLDVAGKETALPHWVCVEKMPRKRINVEIDRNCHPYDEGMLVKMLGNEPNTTNLLVETRSEAISATGVETLAACPLKYFYRHELKLRSDYAGENADLIDKKDSGSLIHELLQDFIEQDLTASELFAKLDSLLVEAFETGQLPNTASISMNRNLLVDTLKSFLEINAERNECTSQCEVSLEQHFEFDHESILLKGKVDRIDTDTNGSIYLIDYKTGKHNNKKSTDFFHFGNRIQLAIYALILNKNELINSIEYWHLNEATSKNVSYKVNEDELNKMKQIVAGVLSILTTNFRVAKPFSALETKDGYSENDQCSNCEFDDICYIENRELWESVSLAPELTEYVSTVSKPIDESDQ